jgi:hypothetical protein
MAKIEVKRVFANITKGDMQPHWVCAVDYGAFEVNIPLPARYLNDDDAETRTHEFVEAMESLGKALLDFAHQTRTQMPRDPDKPPE